MNTEFEELVSRVAEATAQQVLEKCAELYGWGQEWLNERQAARLLSLSPKTLEKLRATGGGPEFLHIGRLVRYSRSELRAWARARERGGVS